MSQDRIKEAGLKLGDSARALTEHEKRLAYTAREAAISATRTYEDLVNWLCQAAAGREQEAANDA